MKKKDKGLRRLLVERKEDTTWFATVCGWEVILQDNLQDTVRGYDWRRYYWEPETEGKRKRFELTKYNR